MLKTIRNILKTVFRFLRKSPGARCGQAPGRSVLPSCLFEKSIDSGGDKWYNEYLQLEGLLGGGKMKRTAFLVLILVAGATGKAFSLEQGYGLYTGWEDWARLRLGWRAELVSSYDRTGGNKDASYYESPPGFIQEPLTATLGTIQGPGMIYRFWMPHLIAKQGFPVRMYFDGEATPRIDSTSIEVLGGTFNYFSAPLVTTFAGGQVCYEPIGFSESVRIETDTVPSSHWSAKWHYYQFSCITFPPGTEVDSYSGSLTSEQQTARQEMVSLFDNAGIHPAGDNPTAVEVSAADISIPAAQCATVADLSGPGLIRRLNLRMDGASDAELEALRLKVYYDGQAAPAIDASVGRFFGAGSGRATYRSLPIGTDSPHAGEGFYCYWPMPFAESVLVQLCNTGGAEIAVDSATVEYEPKEIDRDMCYLHAVENASIKQEGQIYHNVLSTTGRGHYVGELLYVVQDVNDFWMLEGDDVITVDGTETLYGTGLEDIYNGGYYYNWVAKQTDEPEGIKPRSAIRPLNGILYVHRETGFARADQYRWRIADGIPFTRSIDVKVECRYSVTGASWTSVVFWYQLPGMLEDINADGGVDALDFAAFGLWFGKSNCDRCGGAELTGNGAVWWHDFGVFTDMWLAAE